VPSGWLPWYAENRVHFLGWAEQPGSGLRYGLELEGMALLSRLLPDFPTPVSPGEAYTLLDGSGRVFHRSGPEPGPGDARVAVPVGPELPHWQVAVSWAPGGPGGGFALLSTLLVGCFVAAILLGGSLLLWQARSQWQDAQRKTSFVSNVSHELKTPLTTIRMYAELLAEGRVGDAAKRRGYLEVIVAESQRLTRLVNNVLEFGRLEQRRKRVQRTPLDLVAVVREVLAGLEPRLREAGMAVGEARIPPAAPLVSDRDALEQILLNLLDNSLKYASEGTDIAIEIERIGEHWAVRVGDRGPGIPAAHRKRVFDTFHRVDDSLTADQPGSGLGLSISRQLARHLGGDLTCREREGGGTWFELALPAAEGGSR
jgi:signal transduction histidine kinase